MGCVERLVAFTLAICTAQRGLFISCLQRLEVMYTVRTFMDDLVFMSFRAVTVLMKQIAKLNDHCPTCVDQSHI